MDLPDNEDLARYALAASIPKNYSLRARTSSPSKPTRMDDCNSWPNPNWMSHRVSACFRVFSMACARIELDAMFLRCFLAQIVPDPQRQDQNAFRPAGGVKGLHFPPPAVGHIKRWNDGFRL